MSTYINTRTNERRDVIFKYSDIPVTVDYFWDDHGEFTSLTACGHQTSFWSSAEAEIHKYSYTENLINQGANFSIYQLVKLQILMLISQIFLNLFFLQELIFCSIK